jgi:hypothetical protein
MKKCRGLALLALCGLVVAGLNPSLVRGAGAQSQVKTDIEQLAMDVHAGVARSTLTPRQKEQFREDFRQLGEARRNHELFAEMRAMRKIRATLDSGAFKPEDRKRIKQDLQNIREARQAHHRLGN